MKKFFVFFYIVFLTLSFGINADEFPLIKPKLIIGSEPLNQPEFLTVDLAFSFNYEQQSNKLKLSWTIADGYYLYKDKFKFISKRSKIKEIAFPKASEYNDSYFGNTDIYNSKATIILTLSDIEKDAEVTIHFQGCAKAGLCYPPETLTIYPSELTGLNTNDEMGIDLETKTFNKFSSYLLKNNFVINLGIFFLLGIGLAFTPCVFPMYPILSRFIVGSKKSNQLLKPTVIKQGKAFALSVSYVQGMALTYTLLGLVIASAGIKYQTYLQIPIVLLLTSFLFFILAFSMFGFFNFQIPSLFLDKLTSLSNSQKSGQYAGVFFMGMISALICSPCTTAPLTGILLYIANSGDLQLGAFALYAMSLGMGLPLIVLGTFGARFLPKVGNWMNVIKTFFGFLLLWVSISLLDPIIPNWIIELLYVIIQIVFAIYLLSNLFIKSKFSYKRLVQQTLIIIISLSLIWNTITNAYPILIKEFTPSITLDSKTINFKKIYNLKDLDQVLEASVLDHKIVMLDFFALWCDSCKQFSETTFSNIKVQEELENIVLLQLDITEGSDQEVEILEKYKVLGIPTIIFFFEGKEISNSRITGYLNAKRFSGHLESLTYGELEN